MIFKILFPPIEHSVRYNPAIDGLRGVAVLLVVLFHIYPDYFSFGYIGVDIFFVISGFLISQIIIDKNNKGTFSFKEFYRNRIRRIFPAMLVVLLFFYVVGYLFMFPVELKSFSNHIVWSGLFAENWKLIRESNDYWDVGSFFKPILHYWSLSIEEQFYLLWPLIIMLLHKMRWRMDYALIVLIVLGFTLPQSLGISNMNAYFNSMSRFWELMAGALVAVLIIRYSGYRWMMFIERMSGVVLILFLFSVGLSFGNKNFSYYKTGAIIISTGLLIISIHREDRWKVLSSFLLVSIGLISYSLYLWHYPVISFIRYIFGIEINGLYLFLTSLILSYFSYRFIELPFRKNNSYRWSIGLVSFSLILIGIAYYTQRKNGLTQRKHIQYLAKYYTQLEWVSRNDTVGQYLIQKLMGDNFNIDYIRATSADTTKKYILVIGDSHAAVSYVGISAYAKHKNTEAFLLSNSGCAPYVFHKKQKENNLCINKNERIFELINKHKNKFKSIVFVTRSFGIYYSYLNRHGKKEYENLIERTFQKLSSFNLSVYFLIQIPELSDNDLPSYYLPRPFNIAPVKPPFRSQSIYEKQREYIPIIKEIAEKYPNISIIDPIRVFCDGQKCYIIRNDKLLYYDDDHISIDGSYLLGEYIVNQIFNTPLNQ